MNEFENYSVTDLPSPKRLESLADGVFAVSMTLLAVGLAIPEIFQPSRGTNLSLLLSRMWLKFAIYGISFLILGVFWILHQKQFSIILGYDGVFLLINIIFLMFVAIVPFSVFLLYQHYNEWLSIVFYGTNQILICQLLFLNWCYASHRHRLIRPDISPQQCKKPMILFQFISFGFLAAIVVASFSPMFAFVFFSLTLIVTIVILASRHRILDADQRELDE